MASRSLVTGVAGFIGSHVAAQLVAMGHDVTGIDNFTGGFPDNLPEGVRFIRADCEDAATIDRIFAEGRFDTVFHLAAYAAEGLSHFIRIYNYRTNILGASSLINASVMHGVRRFVFTSSIAVYGQGTPPYREDQHPAPEDPYGIAKFAVEMDLRAAHDLFGLEYTIFRPHNVYGERQNYSDAYRNVVCIFLSQALAGRPMTIFGDGSQTRAFSYIGDVAPVLARAGTAPEAANAIFNIGAGTPVRVGDLAQLIARALGIEPQIDLLPPRREVLHAISDISKAVATFGLDPARFIGVEEGIARMVEWIRRCPPREPLVFRSVEVNRNLPAGWNRADLKRTPVAEGGPPSVGVGD